MQAGLLCELTERPILVNTQSEMPPLKDHSTLRRAYVLEEIARRRACEVVVVKSDYRVGWDNLYPPKLGYRQNLNELVDCYFYLANLFVVTAARGLKTMCLGCEFETHQIGKLYDGRFARLLFYDESNRAERARPLFWAVEYRIRIPPVPAQSDSNRAVSVAALCRHRGFAELVLWHGPHGRRVL